ncbi:bpX6 domain-containing protein [Proteus terrae]|uniref:bpX6 domain-containing protein n=1 Tax=Proteus terrae TaxID=1574161 RepID=UPI000D699D42|nr:bpX6 domain-containing protein [Proteus terrae]
MHNDYIRHPMLLGYRQIEGLWLPNDWFNETQRLTYLIKHWQANCRIYRFEQGDVLCFTENKTMDCSSIEGWPLIRYGRLYSTAPLDNDEIKKLPYADLAFVRSGVVTTLLFSQAEPLSLADYLDIKEINFEETDNYASLYEIKPQALSEEKNIRTIIGNNIPPAANQQKQFIKTVFENATSPSQTTQAKTSLSLTQKIINKFLTPQNREAMHSSSKTISQLSPWQRWLNKLSVKSGLASMMSKQQADYINKMIKMFEDGNVDQALRHGIPLSKYQENQETTPSPYLGRLKGRNKLEISANQQGHKSLYFGDELQNYLKQLYRQQFIRLDKAGCNEEALFVLAELLQEKEEALSYLESFQRYQHAAELARMWGMRPDRIIRLYCLAGDIDSAVIYARLHNAFSHVVLQLQEKHPDIADKMREEWAQYLVDCEDYLQAIDIIWQLNNEISRNKAKLWLEIAYHAGGELSLRSLVKSIFLLPDTVHLYQDDIKKICNDPLATIQRAILVRELLALPKQTKLTEQLINQLIRPIIVDQYGANSVLEKKEISQFIHKSTNKLLKTDMPYSEIPEAKRYSLDAQNHFISATIPEQGLYAIYDVIALNDHQYLIALGESGVLLTDKTGKKLWHNLTPTYHIVIAENHQSALLLAPRGDYFQINSLAITTQAVQGLGTLKCTVFTRIFDGVFWTVAVNNTVQVVDTKSDFKIVWNVDTLNGDVIEILRHNDDEHWLINSAPKERWSYILPERRLTQRESLPHHLNEGLKYDLISNSYYGVKHDKCVLTSANSHYTQRLQLPNTQSIEEQHSFHLIKRTATLIYWQKDELTMFRLYNNQNHCTFELKWPTNLAPQYRSEFNQWYFFDKTGRLVHFDWNNGRINTLSLLLK